MTADNQQERLGLKEYTEEDLLDMLTSYARMHSLYAKVGLTVSMDEVGRAIEDYIMSVPRSLREALSKKHDPALQSRIERISQSDGMSQW